MIMTTRSSPVIQRLRWEPKQFLRRRADRAKFVAALSACPSSWRSQCKSC